MADIATLGFKVDTRGLKRGEQALDNFARKGEQTEKRIINSFKKISSRILGIKDVIGNVGLEFAELSNKTDMTRKLVIKDMQQMRNSVKDLNREVKKVPVGFSRVSRSAKTAATNTVASVTVVKKEIISLNRAVGLLATAFLLVGGTQVVSNLTDQSDAWKNVNSQIRQVTDSEEELIKTRKKLFDLTKDTRSELSNTVNLFAELTRGTSELDISSNRLIGVTKTLNNLFVAGGKPISETIGAIRQLNQGFASGVLRGDEFNSVAEGAPKVLDALTRSLGLTRGELREFAATGGITAEVMIRALEAFSREAQRLADQTEKTFSQSLQISATNITKFVGEAELLNSVIGSAVFGMEDLSENLNATSDAAKTLVAVIGVGLTPVMFGYINSLVGTIAAQLTAGTTAIRTANAFSVVTTTAATATVATNTLAIATKFLLGPWGLLLIAIGAAVAVYQASKAASEDITAQFAIEDKAIRKLAKSYEEASVGRLGSDYVAAQRKAIEIDKERNLIQEQMALTQKRIAQASATGQFRDLGAFNEQLRMQQQALETVNLKSAENAKVLNVIGDAFDSLLPKGNEWGKVLSETTITLDEQIKAQLKIGEAFGNTIISLETQRQELLLSADAFEIYQAKIQAIADGATPAMVNAIVEAIKVNQDLRAEIENQEGLEKLTEQVDSFGGAWSQTGSTIIDAFGGMSDALGDYMSRVKDIGKLEAKVADARIVFGADNIEVIKLQQKLDGQKVMAELSGMKAISKAGGSLFAEKTAASKAFAALSKIIAIAEIALSFQKMAVGTTEAGVHVANETVKQGANSLTAITAAFSAPFPIGFAAGAAMIAIMAGLLGGGGGGGGGFGGPSASELAQEAQGTGTVLGSDDKTQSIINAQDRFIDIAVDQLAELRGIKGALTNVTVGISSLAARVAGGSLATAGQAVVAGDVIGGAEVQEVFGARIDFINQSLGQVIDKGALDIEIAFETLTRRTFEILTSRATGSETKVILKREDIVVNASEAINESVGQILIGMGETVSQSVALLGLEGKKTIEEFVVNIGNINLEGLTGEEIQTELEAIFGRQADLMAQFLIPELSNFQRVGEGLFDTLTRITQEQVIFNDAIDFMGDSLSNLSSIMQIEVAQSIITMAGGLDSFSDLTDEFFDSFFTEEEKFERLSGSLNDAVSEMGLSMFETRGAFRAAVEGVDKTTAAGQALFVGLLELAPAFDDFFDGIESNLISLSDNIKSALGLDSSNDLISALAGARRGDFGEARELDIKSLINLNPRLFESAEALAVQEAINRGRLATIAGLADPSVAETELEALNKQISLSQDIADNTLSIVDAITSIPSAVATSNAESSNESNVVTLATIRDEIKKTRDEDKEIQMVILRNSTTSADALQEFMLNGMDVREIT